MILIGADENGLGPLLGPLVITGLRAHTHVPSTEHLKVLKRLRRSRTLAKSLGIDDSKATGSFKKMQHCESIALGLIRTLTGSTPTSINGLLDQVSLHPIGSLQYECSSSAHPQCWKTEKSLPAWNGDADAGAEAIAMWCRSAKITLTHAVSSVWCAKAFNRALTEAGTKFHINLRGFEAVLSHLMPSDGADFQAVCGRNGGMKSYVPHVQKLALEADADSETAQCSEYRVGANGKVRFEVDADSRDPLVGLASMLGKYVRELWMLRINTFYQGHDASLLPISGYRDPRTRAWLIKTQPLRLRLQIEDECLLRER